MDGLSQRDRDEMRAAAFWGAFTGVVVGVYWLLARLLLAAG